MASVSIRINSASLGDFAVDLDDRVTSFDSKVERQRIAYQLEEAARRLRLAYEIEASVS